MKRKVFTKGFELEAVRLLGGCGRVMHQEDDEPTAPAYFVCRQRSDK